MPDYFNYMPKIEYNFPSSIELQVQDIFRRFTFTQKTLEDDRNFEYYIIKDGEKPEDVAHKFYGDARFWWLILFANNIIDVENEWPKDQRELDTLFNTFLKGNSYFVLDSLDIQHNDVIVQRDTTATASISLNNFGIVDSYNSLLRRIDVKRSKGTFSKDDEFYIFRYNNLDNEYQSISGFGLTACVQQALGGTTCFPINGPTAGHEGNNYLHGPFCTTGGSTFGIIKKKTEIKEGIVKFNDVNGDELNPYGVPKYSSSNGNKFLGATGSIFSANSICGLTSTIIYKYIVGGLDEENIKPFTTFDEVIEENFRNRTIKVLHSSIVGEVITEIAALLQGKNIPRGTRRLVE